MNEDEERGEQGPMKTRMIARTDQDSEEDPPAKFHAEKNDILLLINSFKLDMNGFPEPRE